MAITFGDNQYGKAEVRLVHVTRDGDRHQIKDLNVSSALRGDFAAAHLEGDNSHVVATDTQKNTVYAFAQQYGVGEIEDFALRLGRHFVDDFEWVTGAKISIDEYAWDRIAVDGTDHGHAFSRAQMRIAIEILLRRFPRLAIDSARPPEFRGWEFRAPRRLDVLLR